LSFQLFLIWYFIIGFLLANGLPHFVFGAAGHPSLTVLPGFHANQPDPENQDLFIGPLEGPHGLEEGYWIRS
jgi:hypothetical protein